MKPVAFDLETVGTIDAAVELLATAGGDVKILAGGQSLVPLLNLRLARPSLLVDVNRLTALDYVRVVDGALTIGALTRLRTLERSRDVARATPLMHQALPWVAHAAIRNRGTLGGTLAHADPAAELCAVALALDAIVVARGRHAPREIPIAEFFQGPFTSGLRADELLTEIRLPAAPATTHWAFDEVARRRGDFALVGLAAGLDVDTDGTIRTARLAYLSMAPQPVRAYQTERWLSGRPATTATFAAAADLVLDELEPADDLHASRDYRQRVGRALTRRVLGTAAGDPS